MICYDIDNGGNLLGIEQDSKEQLFEFRDKGEVFAFLGIKIEKKSGSDLYLSQPWLIRKVLNAVSMPNFNPNTKPFMLEPLGTDMEGKIFNEQWGYASIINMLMYLANNIW